MTEKPTLAALRKADEGSLQGDNTTGGGALRDLPARALLSLVTSRWAVLVSGALEEGPQRFGALRRRLEGISPKVLTDKLRDLEAEGLLTRTVVDAPWRSTTSSLREGAPSSSR